jgi:hypothetical protein
MNATVNGTVTTVNATPVPTMTQYTDVAARLRGAACAAP